MYKISSMRGTTYKTLGGCVCNSQNVRSCGQHITFVLCLADWISYFQKTMMYLSKFLYFTNLKNRSFL